jgi:hypothetical protein
LQWNPKEEKYWPVIENAWKTLVNSVRADGMFAYVRVNATYEIVRDNTTGELLPGD